MSGVVQPGARVSHLLTRAVTSSEVSDCVIISTFARRESTSVSVGLNAVLVL